MARNLVFLEVKWLRPAMEGTSCVRRVGAGVGVVRTVVAVSMCFEISCASQLHGVVEAEVAKRIVMAAWMLHGLRFGRKTRHETLCCSK